MKWIGLNLVACLMFATSFAAGAPSEIEEIVPTARHAAVTWRYTFDSPAIHEWTLPDFDDSRWQSGHGAFGTPGTPGITPNTRWATRDICMRREVRLPATLAASEPLQLLVFHDEDVEIYFDGVLA